MSAWLVIPTASVDERLRAVNSLAWQSRTSSVVQRWASEARALREPVLPRAALSIVRTHVRFTADPPGEDLYRTPDETELAGGDCDDQTIALLSLLYALGFLALPVWLETPPSWPETHMFVTVWWAGHWWWADPSVHSAPWQPAPWDSAQSSAAV
jgi:hypothetical protein